MRGGPLPAAEELQRYEDIQEGFAERIMQMAEGEQEARHSMIQQAQNAEIDDLKASRSERRFGQILGFLLAVTALLVSAYALHLGHPWWAGIIAAMSIGSICMALVLGRQQQQ